MIVKSVKPTWIKVKTWNCASVKRCCRKIVGDRIAARYTVQMDSGLSTFFLKVQDSTIKVGYVINLLLA